MDRDPIIGDIVARLVRYFQPERIYLFGSAARNQDTPESDLDFLVVLPDSAPRELFLSGREYESLAGIPVPVDVIPIRRRNFEARRDWLMSLPAIAIREGRVVYERKTSRLSQMPAAVWSTPNRSTRQWTTV